MKNQEELNQLKKEYESLKAKLMELSEDELMHFVGGKKLPPKPDDERYIM